MQVFHINGILSQLLEFHAIGDKQPDWDGGFHVVPRVTAKFPAKGAGEAVYTLKAAVIGRVGDKALFLLQTHGGVGKPHPADILRWREAQPFLKQPVGVPGGKERHLGEGHQRDLLVQMGLNVILHPLNRLSLLIQSPSPPSVFPILPRPVPACSTFFAIRKLHTGLAHHTDVVSGLGDPCGHMVSRGAKQFANLLTGVSVNAHPDGPDAFRRGAGGCSFSPVQQPHQFPTGIPLLQTVVHYAAGQFRRVCGLFPAAACGVLHLCVDLIADQAVGIGGECALVSGLVGLGRLAQANAPDLEEIIIGIDAALVQCVNAVPYYLAHKPHIFFYFYSLFFCKRQHNIHLLIFLKLTPPQCAGPAVSCSLGSRPGSNTRPSARCGRETWAPVSCRTAIGTPPAWSSGRTYGAGRTAGGPHTAAVSAPEGPACPSAPEYPGGP